MVFDVLTQYNGHTPLLHGYKESTCSSNIIAPSGKVGTDSNQILIFLLLYKKSDYAAQKGVVTDWTSLNKHCTSCTLIWRYISTIIQMFSNRVEVNSTFQYLWQLRQQENALKHESTERTAKDSLKIIFIWDQQNIIILEMRCNLKV